MSKSLNNLMHDGVVTELKKYFINNENMKQILDCVAATSVDSNIYKSIASFESADIVNVSEIPVDDEKQKMNYILAKAIDKATVILNENLTIAGGVIKDWGDGLNFDNQSQKLDNALGTLNKPVKTSPIPAYSKMNEGQRKRTQEIFNKYAQQSEPVSIDYISEAIDRYNAGANTAVLSNALDITITHKNSVALYNESIFLELSEPNVLSHLISRFHLFKIITDTIASENNRMTIEKFLSLMAECESNKNMNVHNKIKSITTGLDFTGPVDEYVNNSKETAGYNDVKPHAQGVNHLKPLDKNTIERLNALCKFVSALKDVSINPIDTKQTSMTEMQAYDAISTYFNFIEEFTQNLVVFMYITQIAVRNHNVIDDVISITTQLCEKVSNLFKEVNDNVPEDGEVSQESVNAAINYITPKASKVTTLEEAERQQQLFGQLNDGFNSKLVELERLRLRGSMFIEEANITQFKEKQGNFIKESIGQDITDMSGEDIFNLITSKYLGENNNLLNGSAIALNLVMDNSPQAKMMRELLDNQSLVSRILSLPFATTTTKTFASGTEDLHHHLSNLEEDLASRDMAAAKKSLEAFDYVLQEGSYYGNVDKLDDQPVYNTVTTVPRVPYTALDGESYAIGYGELDRSSQELLFDVYKPSGNSVSLNTTKYNPLVFELANQITHWHALNDICKSYQSKSAPLLQKMPARLEAVKASLVKNNIDDVNNDLMIDGIIADVNGALSDSIMRCRLTNLTYETAVNINETLCSFYNKNAVLIDDFIKAIK